MAYGLSSHVDLSRPSSGGAQLTESWATDREFAILLAKGLIHGEIAAVAPGDTTKLWLDTSAGVTAPAPWKKWDGAAWIAVSGTDVAAHIVARGTAGGTSVSASTPLTGNGLGGTPLDIDFSAMSAGDIQAIAAKLAADATALEAAKDAIIGDLDAADVRAIVNAIQADLATAHDDLKDFVFANLEATDARAVVNAIQADATALNDLLTSVPSGAGTVATGDNTTGFDLGATNGHWMVFLNDAVFPASNVNLKIARDGATFSNVGGILGANGVKMFLAFFLVAGAGAGGWCHVIPMGSSGVSENSNNGFSLSNSGFNAAENANVKIKLESLTSIGNVRYIRLN